MGIGYGKNKYINMHREELLKSLFIQTIYEGSAHLKGKY